MPLLHDLAAALARIVADGQKDKGGTFMRRLGIFLAVTLLATGALAASAVASPPADQNFIAILSGDNEVPARDTRARGVAVFRLSDDGASLSYKLIVANIDNVVASHIHVGAAGVNGPVVAFLAGSFPAAGGRTNGVLAEGTITAASLVGQLAGQSLANLVAAMNAGNTYVNVHTNDGVTPADTGPGDFPGGEVRGQIRANGP